MKSQTHTRTPPTFPCSTFDCCGEKCGSSAVEAEANGCLGCPTLEIENNGGNSSGLANETRSVHLRVDLNYTRDLDNIQPVQMTYITTPDCRLFYDVFANDEAPENLSETTWTVPPEGDMVIVKALGHQHTGA